MKVRKEKSIYHTLNMFSLDVTKKCLVGEGWSPVFATKLVFFSFCYTSINQNFHLWCTGEIFYPDTQKHFWLDFCRSRMHCRGHHLTLTPKLEQFFRFCKQRNHHLLIFGQTNSLLLSKKLLIHMGRFLPNIVFTYAILIIENCCWWLKEMWNAYQVSARINASSHILLWS